MKMTGRFDDIALPPLLIQPLAENAIKHGLKNMKGDGRIEIRAEKKKDSVTIEVIDNGAGLKTKDPFTRTLGNIARRLRFHYRDSDIGIKNKRGAGVRVWIRIMLKNTGGL